MNPATEQFKFPFDSGEPLIFPIQKFWMKTSYDKYYVLNVDDFLARGEVVENAIKNTHLIYSKQVVDMSRRSDFVDFAAPPECFGVFLGQFIPFASGINGIPWATFTLPEMTSQTQTWSKEFFEMYLDFWLLVMLNPEHKSSKVQSVCNKPVWVKLTPAEFLPIWETRYNQMKSARLLTCVDYENRLELLKTPPEHYQDEKMWMKEDLIKILGPMPVSIKTPSKP